MSSETFVEQDFSLVLASSVHDMKNSLNMLLYSLESEIKSNPPATDAQAKRFAVLQYEASRINSDLIQLLSIYRLQNQRLPFNLDEHYVGDIIEEQIDRNEMLFHTRNLTVEVDCSDDMAWYLDAELVGSVIHNVLINAARYSRKQLRVSAHHRDGGLRIDIADDGSGFPEQMLTHWSTASKDVSGKGADSTQLGLYFAQRIALIHQQKDRCGYINLSNNSALGGGLFSLWLP